MYKIKLIRKDYNTQIEKNIYETTNKFNRYGKDYFKSKHNNSYNSHHIEAYCKLYHMDMFEKWNEIQIPEDWIN